MLRLAVLMGCAMGCGAVEWVQPDAALPASWGGLRLHETDGALVLASSEGAAREVLALVEEARGALVAAGAVVTGRLLLIALDEGDPPLMADEEGFACRIGDWHARAIGRPPPGESGGMHAESGEPEAGAALLARLIAFALPRDDEELGVPAALREAVVGVLLLPTSDGIASAVDALMDLARAEMAQDEDVGLAERAMIAAATPFVKSMMRKEFLRQNQARALELMVALAVADPSARNALLLAAFEQADLDAEDAELW